ncbi:hypothetical protein Taro_012769 [Colocasia esculenta]|uniref:Aminotransferase-like plant mobile domain-containing protein n=1 Tax=Colocasia esculenta TaxID=4460 RepID=A0A843UA30_COLES|nr:hypothetical protein [Colocasia esculenta]
MSSVDNATVRGVSFMSRPNGVSRLCRGGPKECDMNATTRCVASRTDLFKNKRPPSFPLFGFQIPKLPYLRTFPNPLHSDLLASSQTQPKTTPIAMEGGKEIGEGSSRRKCHAERWSSRRWAEEPPVEGEVPEVEMEEEEEETAPVVNMEEERKNRAKAMKTHDLPRHSVAAGRGVATLSRRLGQTRPYRGLRRWRDTVAVSRNVATRTLVLAVFLAFPPFQREQVEEMGFGEIFRIERMRVDSALTQALRSRWDTKATAFAFPWGHMIPSLEDLAEQLLDLPVERRSSLVPRVALQESLGLYEAGKNAGESEDEYLLLFATRGDAVHCRFLPLLEDLGEVGGYAWGAAFLAHQFDGLSISERQTSTSGFYPFLQVWAYLHLPALGRGDLTRPGLVPIARRWDSCRDTRHLADQVERLQEAIDSYAYLDVVWQPYLGEGDEGQPWLAQARPYFGRSVWLHALNLVLPLNLFLTQCSLGLRQSVVEFLVGDHFRRPGRSFRGLHDTTDWHERAREQIENWERKGKVVRSDATTDDAYLQAYALKYGGKVYKSARHQVDVTGEIASLRALLHSAVQDREAAQRQTAELRSELERVRGAGAGGASSSRSAGGSPSLLEARLAGAVLRAEEAQRHLEERERDLQLTTEHAMDLQGQRDQFRGERDQLRTRAEAAEAQVAEATRELAALRAQRPPGDQEEVIRLRAELLAQRTLAQGLQQIVTDIGCSRSRSRSGASVSRVTGASVGQYLAGSSSRWRNEEEERRRPGEGSAQDGRGGGEMLPPPDRQEGSGESGGGQ